MTVYEREVPRRLSTLPRRFDFRGPRPAPAPKPAPTPKHTVLVPIGLRTPTDASGKPLEDLIREKVEAYAAGRTVTNLTTQTVFVDENGERVPGFQQAAGRVVVCEFNATQPQPEPEAAPETPATGEKPTTITVHGADASLESPEDALQRGLRDLEDRRRRAVRRPGPTRW